MKKIIIAIVLFILVGTIWVVYNTNENTKENNNKVRKTPPLAVSQQPLKKEPDKESQKGENKDSQTTDSQITDSQAPDPQSYSGWSDVASQGDSPFPPPFVNKIGDITQRTIHVGVRQWEWLPVKMTANYGERVVMIMHNADVLHSISIPELNVRQDIPDDGAVVQFVAAKRGTFTFFCDTPCGKDHDKMKGEITIA